MADQMNCSDAQLLISKRLDDACGAADAAAVDRHLAACPACRRCAADMLAVSRVLDQAGRVAVRPDFVQRVMSALPLELNRRTARTIRIAQMALGVAAFAGGLLISGSFDNGADTANAQDVASRETAARPTDLGDMLRPEALDGDLILAMTGSEDQPWQR